MRHNSRGGTVDTSQSLYTKEGFSHLFGINKKVGREYKVAPSYETVVTESPTVTQMDGAAVDSETEDLELVGSTMMHSGSTQPADTRTGSVVVDFESLPDTRTDSAVVNYAAMDSGTTRPDVLILEPEIIDLTLSP